MLTAFSPGSMDLDARGDLVGLRKDGNLYFYRNLGGGKFGYAKQIGRNWQNVKSMA